jgi:hypothetical protein
LRFIRERHAESKVYLVSEIDLSRGDYEDMSASLVFVVVLCRRLDDGCLSEGKGRVDYPSGGMKFIFPIAPESPKNGEISAKYVYSEWGVRSFKVYSGGIRV